MVNEAAAFGDLGLRKVDFHDTSGRVHSISVFFADAYWLKASFCEIFSLEVDLVLRSCHPTAPAMEHENHEIFDEKS